MTRRALLMVAALSACGAIVAATLRPSDEAHAIIGGSTFAQVAPHDQVPYTLDIVRNNATSTLQFSWDVDSFNDVTMYSPGALQLIDAEGQAALDLNTYQSSTSAWAAITAEYGVTQTDVTNALNAGTTSGSPGGPSPPDVANQDQTVNPYDSYTHYGTSLTSLRAAIGFAVPKVTSLNGYGLVDSAITVDYGSDGYSSGQVASLWFGGSTTGDSMITVDIAVANSANPSSWGSAYATTFGDSAQGAALGGTTQPAWQVGSQQALMAYSNAWVSVSTNWVPTASQWQTILNAIASAPSA